MSVLNNYPSTSARDAAYPAASNIGRCIFRTDTKAIEVSDGTNYLSYNNDGITYDLSGSNTHSGVFDGAGDHIDIGTLTDLNTSSDFSFACWFNFNGTPVNEPLFAGGDGTSTRAALQFRTNTTFRLLVGGSTDFTVSSLTTDGSTWYHVAVTVSGTSATLYLDGSSVGTATVSVPASTAFNDVHLGANNGTAAYGGSTASAGPCNLDEMVFFNRAITATEVSNIYNNKIYVGPTAMYRLDNGVTDETGNYNGTNNGVTFSTTDKPY